MKEKTKLVLLFTIVIGGFCAYGIVRVYCTHFPRIYEQRCKECDARDLIPGLERSFSFSLPEKVQNIQSAKSLLTDAPINFMVKFTTELSVVDEIIKSFPKKLESVPYQKENDTREFMPSPKPPSLSTPGFG